MELYTEIIDSVDLAEYANAADVPLGTIPLTFGDNLLDTDFDEHGRVAYVESDHLGVGGFFNTGQTMNDVFVAINDCIENQCDDALSEFVIPLSRSKNVYLYIRIGGQ